MKVMVNSQLNGGQYVDVATKPDLQALSTEIATQKAQLEQLEQLIYANSERGKTIIFMGSKNPINNSAVPNFSPLEDYTNDFWGKITVNNGIFTFSQPGTWYVIVEGWSNKTVAQYNYSATNCTFKTFNNGDISNGWTLPIGSDTDNIDEQSCILTATNAGATVKIQQNSGSGTYLQVRFKAYNSPTLPNDTRMNNTLSTQ